MMKRSTSHAALTAAGASTASMWAGRVKNGAVDVYLDSAVENFTPELALHAERLLPDRWNGWLRPVATASALGRFLDAWRQNDPNGIWGYVTEVGDVLVCSAPDADDPADEFPRCGETESGTPLYDLTGWAWTEKPDE